MNVELAREIRVELDYGFSYLKEAFNEETANRSIAMEKILEARMALGVFVINSGGVDMFPSLLDQSSDVVERPTDIIDSEILRVNTELSEGRHLKYLLKGLSEILSKVIGIRMNNLGIQDSKKSFLALRSLDRTIDCVESAIGFLSGDLQRVAIENPEVYPAFRQNVEEDNKVVEEVEKTNSIIEHRVAVVDSDENTKPLSGVDYLPGGRAYIGSSNESSLETTEEE